MVRVFSGEQKNTGRTGIKMDRNELRKYPETPGDVLAMQAASRSAASRRGPGADAVPQSDRITTRAKANIAKTAAARERACFLWGMMNGRRTAGLDGDGLP